LTAPNRPLSRGPHVCPPPHPAPPLPCPRALIPKLLLRKYFFRAPALEEWRPNRFPPGRKPNRSSNPPCHAATKRSQPFDGFPPPVKDAFDLRGPWFFTGRPGGTSTGEFIPKFQRRVPTFKVFGGAGTLGKKAKKPPPIPGSCRTPPPGKAKLGTNYFGPGLGLVPGKKKPAGLGKKA